MRHAWHAGLAVGLGWALLIFAAVPNPAQAQAGGAARVAPRPKRVAVERTAEKTRPDVVFVPTPQVVVDHMLELAQLKKGDILYDLGCGDGRIVVTAAKKYGVKAVGVDIDPVRIQESLENVRRNGVSHLVTIRRADIFTLDLREASVVTLYLLPNLNVRLLPQLERLKPGSRVVSHSFDIRGVKPNRVVKVRIEGRGVRTAYLYVVPFEKDPTEAVPPGSGAGRLR